MAEGMDININKHIHERARLMILTYLSTNDSNTVSFNELKSALGLTGGNLSVQLRNLEEVGYLKVTKSIEKRRTVTRVSLTEKGYHEFIIYLENMEKIIKGVKPEK